MNQLEIQLISGTTIDWDNYVRKCHNILGRSPTRSLDSNHIRAGSYDSFIASIGEFQKKGTNPHKYLELHDSSASHLSFTFLCFTTKECYYTLLENANELIITQCKDMNDKPSHSLFIVTGSLKHWHESILTFLQEEYPSNLREFFAKIFFILNSTGLKLFFSSYRIRSNILEEK